MLPKFTFFLRTSTAFYHQQILGDIDVKIRDILSSILNVKLERPQWQQAVLPAKMGGLGIGSVALTSSSAYLSSITASNDRASELIDLPLQQPSRDDALRHWCSIAEGPAPVASNNQRDWTAPVYDRLVNQLVSSLDAPSQRRFLGASAPGAGDWLKCLPSSPLGLRLNKGQLRIAVGLRIGAPVSSPYICVCGAPADSFGSHVLSCRRSCGRHHRHSMLNQIIHRALRASGTPAVLEPTGLSRNDGKRPDGMSLIPWNRGKCLLWDATVVHRLASCYSSVAGLEGATAAETAERRKRSKYSELLDGYAFEPAAFETLGGIGPSTLKFVKAIGLLLQEKTGDRRETSFLRQRLAIAIQVGNAACVQEALNHT